MDVITLLIVIGTLASWGIGSFLSKIVTNRIGTQGVFWQIIGSTPAIILYSLMVFHLKNLIQVAQTNKPGVGLAIWAGVMSSFGMIGFYLLLTRGEASTMTPLTALYPALTAVLAFIFLHESITSTKIIGIILSLIAIYLLSK